MNQPIFASASVRVGRTLRVLAGAMIAAAGLYVSAALANHIDFFDQGPFAIAVSPSPETGSATQANPPSGASTLGARRDVQLFNFGPGGPFSAAASLGETFPLRPGENDDALLFSLQEPARGALLVRLGAGGALNANFVDIPDFISDWDRVRVDFGPSSASPAVQILLTSDGMGTATVEKPFAGGNANLDFLLTEFTAANSAFTASVLRDIDSVVLVVIGDPGGSYFLESFERSGSVTPPDAGQVPVPGVAGLLTIGALGLLRRRVLADSQPVRRR